VLTGRPVRGVDVVLTERWTLSHGLIAVVVKDDGTDRSPSVPQPVPRSEHDLACGCPSCVQARQGRLRLWAWSSSWRSPPRSRSLGTWCDVDVKGTW